MRLSRYLILFMVVTAARLDAQAADTTKANEQLCLRFSFGAWTPPLNWQAAGHGAFPDTSRMPHAAAGRDWAQAGTGSDTTMMLFPAWWPVGVIIELPTRTPALGDTVTGRAIALRANVDSSSPKATVHAWRIRC